MAVLSAIAVTASYSFLYSFSVDQQLLNDSRVRVSRWIEDKIPAGAVIGVFSYPRYLPNFNTQEHGAGH